MTTISERKFSICISSLHDEVTAYYVTDVTDEEFEKEKEYFNNYVNTTRELLEYKGNDHYRPRVATFPVSQLHDKDSQKIRAKMLCDYLNKIQEATNKAIRNTNMIDALSINPNP